MGKRARLVAEEKVRLGVDCCQAAEAYGLCCKNSQCKSKVLGVRRLARPRRYFYRWLGMIEIGFKE